MVSGSGKKSLCRILYVRAGHNFSNLKTGARFGGRQTIKLHLQRAIKNFQLETRVSAIGKSRGLALNTYLPCVVCCAC